MSDTETAPVLTPRFSLALAFACEWHRTQVRKSTGVPHVSHLLAVSGLALEHGANEDEAIAALLHDAVEDQGGAGRAAEIEKLFGATVARIVLDCSDADTIPKPPWRARKEAYIEHMRQASASTRLVSACDKLHNVRTLVTDYRTAGEELWSRFKGGGREGTLWYYRALVEAFGQHGPSSLLDELDRAVGELERLSA